MGKEKKMRKLEKKRCAIEREMRKEYGIINANSFIKYGV